MSSKPCRSWRYVTGSDSTHFMHEPGTCRTCWRRCGNKTEKVMRRCDDCLTSLLSHPNSSVRAALLQEPHVEMSTLVYLTSDNDPAVAFAATNRIEEHNPLGA